MVAVIAMAGVIAGAILSQIGGWLGQRRVKDMATGRIQALLREQRYYADRGLNEVRYQNSLFIYHDPWQRCTAELRSALDAADHSLNGSQVLSAYTACFRAQEALFADNPTAAPPGKRQPFDKHLLMERVEKAQEWIIRAQEMVGDPDPMAYYRA